MIRLRAIQTTRRPGLAVLAAGWMAAGAAGAPAGGEPDSRLDRWHGLAEQRFTRTAESLDQRLSHNHESLEKTDSDQLRLSLTAQYRDERFRLSPSGNLRLALPLTQRRVHLILDRFSREDSAAGERDINDRDERDDHQTGLGMRFIALSRETIRQHVDAGVSLPRVNPFVRANAIWSRVYGPWRPQALAQVSWQADDGFGAKLVLDPRRRLAPRLWAQSASEASWLANVPGLKLVQGVSLHWLATERDTLSPLIEATARTHPYAFEDNGHDHPATFVEQVWCSLRYRRRLHREWLYLEAEPGFYFSREYDFGFEPSVRLKLEVLFGTRAGQKPEVSNG